MEPTTTHRYSRSEIQFASRQDHCAGVLFLPTTSRDQQVPAVVLAHGNAAVKEMHLEPFAVEFAEAGIAALVFDYRYFGASGGEPRQQILPYEQLEDYRSALSWLAIHSDVDAERLGAWGTSFAGGHALHLAAFDPRVKAAVSQTPAIDLAETAKRLNPPELMELILAGIAADRTNRYPDGPSELVTFAAPEGGFGVLTDTDTYEWLMGAHRTVAPSWRNEVTVESIERMLEYAPGNAATHIDRCALMMIVADSDDWAPVDMALSAFARIPATKELVMIPGGHYSVYGGTGQQLAAEAAARWFSRHLTESSSSERVEVLS